MKAYRVLVHDLRERAPIELTAELASDARANEFARERLASSASYMAIEVWRGEVKLLHLRSGLRVAA